MKITVTVNSKKRRLDVPPMKRLLDTLREDLGLTGTKEGCGEGECGACTVLLDGDVVNSCLVATSQAEGAAVLTVEGLAKGDKLSRLQQAFLECGATQCGICPPGMLVAASALPKGSTREAIREALAGNLCRCTGYVKIYDAVEKALAPKGKPKPKPKLKPEKSPATRARRGRVATPATIASKTKRSAR